jgi:hypothetical protein
VVDLSSPDHSPYSYAKSPHVSFDSPGGHAEAITDFLLR